MNKKTDSIEQSESVVLAVPAKRGRPKKVIVAEPVVKEEVKETHIVPEKEPKAEVKLDIKLSPFDSSELKCQSASKMVLGYVDGEEYCSRKVILFHMDSTVFGDGEMQKKKYRKLTINKGIVNHCDIRAGEAPSSYWAVMDAMSELGKFTKDEVIALAMETMRGAGCKTGKKALESACTISFNVLHTHERHPSKKKTGMTYICRWDGKNADGKKVMFIRGREAGETYSYFENEKAKSKQAEVDGKPLMTVHLKTPL